MPSEPRSSRSRADDVWIPGDKVPPADGPGVAALKRLDELRGPDALDRAAAALNQSKAKREEDQGEGEDE